MKMRKGKKRALIATIAAIVLGAGAAFAYFTSTGSGTGSAGTGNATQALTIQQIGAGYNSLITSNSPDPYIQDQCFSCANITELGDNITLANPGAQQLVNVIVAFRNWNNAVVSGVPFTLTIDNGIAGPISDTETPTIPAAIVAGANPSLTDVTFNFASQGAFVNQQFTYGITFDASGVASGVNVALSSSTNNLSVGHDTNPGYITLATTTTPGNPMGDDFPTCTVAPTGFNPVHTNCGPENPANPGAYGTEPNNADIPAVQVNVVGGVVTGLYPGGPAQPINYAITNPNSSSVYVNQVTTSITGLSNTGSLGAPAVTCTTSMYSIGYPTATVGESIPQGTSIFDATGTSISMTETNTDQDNCEGADVGLGFTST